MTATVWNLAPPSPTEVLFNAPPSAPTTVLAPPAATVLVFRVPPFLPRMPRLHGAGRLTGTAIASTPSRSVSLLGLGRLVASAHAHEYRAGQLAGRGALTAVAARPVSPPVFDSAADGFHDWSHTLTDQATILLVGGFPPSGVDVVGTTRTAAWGTTPMTSLGATELSTQPGNSWLEIFVLMNPEPGTKTITLDNSAGANTRGVSVAYQNVFSYGPLVASAGPGGIGGLLGPDDAIATGSIATSIGEIAVGFFAAEDGDIVVNPDVTTRAANPPTNSNVVVQETPGTGENVVFTNQLGGFQGLNEWAAYGLTLSPAPAVTPPTTALPTFGTVGPDINSVDSPPPSSWTQSTTAGDYVFVPIVIGDSGTDMPSIETLTFAGAPMTFLGSQIFDTSGATGFLLFLYGYPDAPAGSHTISFEPGAGTWQYAATSFSCRNVTSVRPLQGITEGGGGKDTTMGQEITCSLDDLIVQIFATTAWTLSAPTGGTNTYLGPATNGSGPTLAVNIATSDTIFTAAINHNDYWAGAAVVLEGPPATTVARSASLSGHGGLVGVGHAIRFALSAQLAGHGALHAVGRVVGVADLSGSGLLSATATPVAPPATPPTFDTVGAGTNGNNLLPHFFDNATAGAYVLTGLCAGEEDDDPTVASAQLNGDDMTLLGSQDLGSPALIMGFLYGYTPAPGGSDTGVAITLNPGLDGVYNYTSNSVSYLGVASVGTAQIVSGHGPLSQTVTCPDGSLVVQMFFATNQLIESPTGGTNRYLQSVGGPGLCISDATTDTTFTAVFTDNDSFWVGIAVVLEGS